MRRVGRFVPLAALALALGATLAPVSPLFAQSSVLSIEGTGGHTDSRHRGPVLSVSTEIEASSTRILVDATSQDSDYNIYPFQFDFYINRHLFSTQIRSPELPGPVGVDVPNSVATPPFNYAVIAKILVPNRIFNSAVFGAVFPNTLNGQFDCTLTVDADDIDLATAYVANAVQTTQVGSDSFTIAFEGSAVGEDGTAAVDGTIAVSGSTASGTVAIDISDEDSQSVALSGTATRTNDTLEAIDLSSVDGATTLKCS